VGRHRKNPSQDDWKKKLYPVFFELADLNREFEKRLAALQRQWKPKLQRNAMARFVRDRNQLEHWSEEQLADIDRRHKPISYNPLAYSYLTLDPPVSDSQGIREYVHFRRHGEALQVTKKKDALGDIKAWDKIARTERDVRILSFGKGPIKPFQEDPLHRQLLQLVICYEREQLTAEELAQCFDRYCACGKTNHETDALRKMRHRFEAELKANADLAK
jgi:hypothetical protein